MTDQTSLLPRCSGLVSGLFSTDDSVPKSESRTPRHPDISGRSAPQSTQPPASGASIPYVTYSLIAVNTLIFVAMVYVSRGDVTQVAWEFGNKNNELIHAGQIWRLVTAIFLHGSWMHLLVNSLSLYMLGKDIELIYGTRRFLIVYLTAGVASFLVSYMKNPVPSLGASGAIFGLVGAGMIFPIRFRNLIPVAVRNQILTQLLLVTVVNLAIGAYPGLHADNWAHMGGLVGGAFAALFLLPEALTEERPRRAGEIAVSAVIAAMLVVVVWAGYSQWSWVQQERQINTPPVLIEYSPPGGDPWWTIGFPAGWRFVRGVWRNPLSATVRITDSAYDPEETARVIALVQATGLDAEALKIDRKQAWKVAIASKKRCGYIYLIQPYPNRYLTIAMDCPTAVKMEVQPDFELILESLRFVHPPSKGIAGTPGTLDRNTLPASHRTTP